LRAQRYRRWRQLLWRRRRRGCCQVVCSITRVAPQLLGAAHDQQRVREEARCAGVLLHLDLCVCVPVCRARARVCVSVQGPGVARQRAPSQGPGDSLVPRVCAAAQQPAPPPPPHTHTRTLYSIVSRSMGQLSACSACAPVRAGGSSCVTRPP
jgi:hypothetical protein